MKPIIRYGFLKNNRLILDDEYKYPILYTNKKKANRDRDGNEKVVKVVIIDYDDYLQMGRVGKDTRIANKPF